MCVCVCDVLLFPTTNYERLTVQPPLCDFISLMIMKQVDPFLKKQRETALRSIISTSFTVPSSYSALLICNIVRSLFQLSLSYISQRIKNRTTNLPSEKVEG